MEKGKDFRAGRVGGDPLIFLFIMGCGGWEFSSKAKTGSSK